MEKKKYPDELSPNCQSTESWVNQANFNPVSLKSDFLYNK